ncbi:lytic transglycosylase domain-containing protein [Ruminococcaceae bacterium OttesenSCG-928-D13]|nr:lytic transglycosylase domain-containing protein [Ruminococcaceae bacterium OttesenSCG-928-D13]
MSQAKKSTRRGPLIALVLAVLLVAGAVLAVPVSRQVQRLLYPVRYAKSVERWAAEYELDPYLVYAFIRTESSFNPKAESSAGARGLMQMTSDTFDWLKGRIAPQDPLSYDDLYDPDQAIRFGSYFISICLERYGGDTQTAAAAYHSGWGTVDGLLASAEYSVDTQKLNTFPYSQMRHYVAKIQSNYQKYLDLYQT